MDATALGQMAPFGIDLSQARGSLDAQERNTRQKLDRLYTQSCSAGQSDVLVRLPPPAFRHIPHEA